MVVLYKEVVLRNPILLHLLGKVHMFVLGNEYGSINVHEIKVTWDYRSQEWVAQIYLEAKDEDR